MLVYHHSNDLSNFFGKRSIRIPAASLPGIEKELLTLSSFTDLGDSAPFQQPIGRNYIPVPTDWDGAQRLRASLVALRYYRMGLTLSRIKCHYYLSITHVRT